MWLLYPKCRPEHLKQKHFRPKTGFFFFFGEGAPQLMLRTHRSLKAYCATLWWRWRWAVFYQVVQVMEHQWNEIDKGKPTTQKNLSQCHFVHHKSHMDLTWDRTRASVVRGRRLTAWAMARSYSSVRTTLAYNDTNIQSSSWCYNRVQLYCITYRMLEKALEMTSFNCRRAWFRRNWNTGKQYYKYSTPLFMWFLSYIGFHNDCVRRNKRNVRYTVRHASLRDIIWKYTVWLRWFYVPYTRR
jgi:hypothetical protein